LYKFWFFSAIAPHIDVNGKVYMLRVLAIQQPAMTEDTTRHFTAPAFVRHFLDSWWLQSEHRTHDWDEADYLCMTTFLYTNTTVPLI